MPSVNVRCPWCEEPFDVNAELATIEGDFCEECPICGFPMRLSCKGMPLATPSAWMYVRMKKRTEAEDAASMVIRSVLRLRCGARTGPS